jgi:serine/threonine protein kinase
MKITAEEGSKKATCPKCGQVVLIPGEAGPPPRRKPGRSPTGSATGEATLVTASARPAPPTGQDNTPVPRPPIHQVPTQTEQEASAPEELTDFLAPAQAPDEIGRLGPYRILRVLGSGGMGVVYLAEDPQLQRQVALKAMRPALAASATARQRFLREARAIAAIQHDHIVTIYAVGEDRGVPFLAMPFLKGESLEGRVGRGAPLPVAEVLRIGREIAEGLAAIHEPGLVHRDIKPANVWLEGEAARVKILDFGLARPARGEEQLTQAGAIVGSPGFMAPEQAGRGPVDARCDLFSLGCLLYLVSTGELPFRGDDALTTLLAVATAEPPPPRQRSPAVPAALSDLVMRLLAKNPEDRPPSARAVRAAIEQIKVAS